MKRYIALLITLFILTILPISSSGYQNEPDGFRGIKWGTDIKTLKDMKYEVTNSGYRAYKRTGDDLWIGKAHLDHILYLFWRGKLSSVAISTYGINNWRSLKKVTFTRFGEGEQSDKNVEKYFWVGYKASMGMHYNEFTGVGMLTITSTKLLEQKKKHDIREAKEEGESGF